MLKKGRYLLMTNFRVKRRPPFFLADTTAWFGQVTYCVLLRSLRASAAAVSVVP